MEEREPYQTNVSFARAEDQHEPSDHEDKLLWRDKIPLTLALVAQSYVVFIWYLHSTHGIHAYVDFVIALAAGISLDWLTVSTVMGRREGRTSIWSWLTSFGAFLGSAMIAYDTYALHWWPLDDKALLHICYPLVVLLYSLHLASPRHSKKQEPSSHHLVPQPPLLAVSEGLERGFTARETETLAVVPDPPTASFTCPSCRARLESIGELGAAKRWGHCRHCKGQATTPLIDPVEHSQNGVVGK